MNPVVGGRGLFPSSQTTCQCFFTACDLSFSPWTVPKSCHLVLAKLDQGLIGMSDTAIELGNFSQALWAEPGRFACRAGVESSPRKWTPNPWEGDCDTC